VIQSGQTLRDGRYAVTRVLGEGAQAATLEAVDKREGRLVAIKRFSIRGADSWKSVELAEREARVLSSLAHPGLPRYLDHFEEQGCLHLVMERIEGESLRELRQRDVRFARDEVVRFLAHTSEVLDYLHSRAPPVIHRDIKPGNVVKRRDGSFVLIDFGSVRELLAPEAGSTVVGTFGYMAPEQFQGRALPASDVYGAGATALALLTGVEPEKLPHRGLAIDVERALAGMADPGMVRALSAMLEPDPDRRAPRIGPLLAELGADPRAPRGRPGWSAPAARRPTEELIANPLLVSLLLVGLWMARVATWALFELILPLVLIALSIPFGAPLRRAAAASRRTGRQGRLALSRAHLAVKDRSERAAAERYAARVSPQTRVRVQAEPVPDRTDDELGRESPPAQRARR
jgi:serine/threonine protein kinase